MKSPVLVEISRFSAYDSKLSSLRALLSENDDWLKDSFVKWVQGCTASEPSSCSCIPWRENIPRISDALVETIDGLKHITAGEKIPVVQLVGIIALGSLRDGYALTSSVTAFKRLTKAYHELVNEKLSNAPDKQVVVDFLNDCFELCEIAICGGWEKHVKCSTALEAPDGLGQKERFFSAIYENASVSIAIVSLNGTIVMANQTCSEVAGYSSEEITGQSLTQFIHPDELPEVGVNVAKLFSGELKIFRTERKLLKKDGTVFHADMSTTPILDGDGNVASLIVVMVDINARKEAEIALARNEQLFRAIYDNASISISLVSTEGIILSTNAKSVALCGYSQDEIVGSHSSRFYHPDELENMYSNTANLISGKAETLRSERHMIHKNGSSYYVDQSSSVILGPDGKVEMMIVAMADITERKLAEMKLMESERELQRYKELMKIIMDGSPALMGYVDVDLRYKFVNSYYESLHAVSPDDVIGKRVPDLIGEETFGKVEHYYRKALAGVDVHYEMIFDSAGMGIRHLEVNYLPHEFEGKIEGLIILILDVTERKKAEEQRDRFFDVSLDMFYVAGFDGHFRLTNPACTKTLGWSKEELKGQRIMRLVHPEDRRRTFEKVVEIQNDSPVISFENRVRCKDGSYRWVTWNSLPLMEEKLVYAIGHDTTNRREMEEKLRTMATIDPLTKVKNRRNFFDLGEVEFVKAKRYEQPLSAFMLDIDHFKKINDTYGHQAGDRVLQDLAVICQNVMREGDLFCRYGGEEFAGLVVNASGESVQQTAQRLLDAINSYVCKANSVDIRISASIGTTTLNANDMTLDAMLNRADRALYKAKKDGRNRFVHLEF